MLEFFQTLGTKAANTPGQRCDNYMIFQGHRHDAIETVKVVTTLLLGQELVHIGHDWHRFASSWFSMATCSTFPHQKESFLGWQHTH
jgi:hypothetical protein